MKIKLQNKIYFSIFFTVSITVFIILSVHQVSKSITDEDKEYIPKILNDIHQVKQKDQTYEEKLESIAYVQRRILHITFIDKDMPKHNQKEPKDVFLTKKNLCYDKSRIIEKCLIYLGFKTRHIFICKVPDNQNWIKTLFTRGAESHAITEVLTSRGWLVVDSNSVWLSKNKKKDPVSIALIQKDIGKEKIIWEKPIPNLIYQSPFVYIYGLYSRHGDFYPPYDFIPDVRYSEFVANFF